jgi:hypothetical protein
MGCRWGSIATALLLAPSPVAAQRITEIGIQAMALAAEPGSVVAGGYGALRTSLRSRVSLAAGAGVSEGRATFRGEALAHFLLSPTRRRGAGFYVAGGLAVVQGPVDDGYIVLTLGLEGKPGAPSGWFVEAGVGGGARLAAGLRHRWLPAGWPGAK